VQNALKAYQKNVKAFEKDKLIVEVDKDKDERDNEMFR